MKRLRCQQGFILLEVILAVTVVAIGLFFLMERLGRCVAAARSVQNYSIAGVLLANKSYEFRVEQEKDYEDQEGNFEDYPSYRWDRKLEPTETENLWKQTITVYWQESGREAFEAVMEYRYLPEKQQ